LTRGGNIIVVSTLEHVFISYAPWRWKKLVTMIFITTINNIYRITAVVKVKTDIITSITASPIGRTLVLVIDYFDW